MDQLNNIETWELSQKKEYKGIVSFDDFNKEADLCDYIELNAELFALDILEEELVSFEREWDLNQYRVYGPRPKRVDFMFKTDKSECILVECKNPTNTYSELRNAVAQLMSYSITCIDNFVNPDRFIIVSTEYHPVVGRMIEHYNLDIEFYLVSKGQLMRLKQTN